MARHQDDFFVLYDLMVYKIALFELMALICGRWTCWIAERMEHTKDRLNLRRSAQMHGAVRWVANTYVH